MDNGIKEALRLYKNGTKEGIFVFTDNGQERTVQFLDDGTLEIDMGTAVIKPEYIPVRHKGEICINKKMEAAGEEVLITCLRIREPHAVCIIDKAIDYKSVAADLQKNDIFPEFIWIDFVNVISANEIEVISYGKEEELSHIGVCASLCALCMLGKTEPKVSVKNKNLLVYWNKMNNRFYLRGSIDSIFKGVEDFGNNN